MPRKKKPTIKGNRNRHGQRGDRQVREASPWSSNESKTPSKGALPFTLQDEARNTERHHRFWDSDQKLRYSTINFVSGGNLDPTISKKEQPEVENATSSLAHISLEPADNEMVVEVYQAIDSDHGPHTSPEGKEAPLNQDSFYVDVLPDPVSTGLPPPRLTSPTPSDSSTEVILFGGRDQYGRAMSRPKHTSTTVNDVYEERIKQVEQELHAKEEILEEMLRRPGNEPTKSDNSEQPDERMLVEVEVEIDPLDATPQTAMSKKRRHRGARQAEEDALLADYIANMEGDLDIAESFKRRPLDNADSSVWQEGAEQLSDYFGEEKREGTGWSRDTLGDFDALSTSDGIMGDVQHILSKRKRKSGVQYLVVWEDQAIDEARWVPTTTLTSVNALLHIERFEAEESLVAEILNNSDSGSSSNVSGAYDNTDIDQPIPKVPPKMSDEHIARLLAKQEELGFDADELLLFDAEDDGEDEEDVLFADDFFTRSNRAPKVRGKTRASNQPKDIFPSAHTLADAYDGFDVLDFERPSLRKRPKGRKGKLLFDLSDSELEASMTAAWENDRVKKKERKQEREELRSQGLLGNKKGKPDLSTKYAEGMGIHHFRQELEQFLASDHTTLALPPMEKSERKAIHDLANAFNIKSKSAGSGKKRFPVLYKTNNVKPFQDHLFEAVLARGTRRFLPRSDVKHRKLVGKGRGSNMSGVSYRDGDVVGASAPELGVENKGRAMLEKMGWSSGTALGALNNKGILQPVSHVVKTSKAGLG